MVSDILYSYLIDLTDYLNQNGFCVHENKIKEILPALEVNDIDITDVVSFIMMTKSFFCSCPGEFMKYEHLFRKFYMEYNKNLDEMNRKKQESEQNKALIDKMAQNINQLEALIHEKIEKANQKQKNNLFSKKDMAIIKGSKEFLIRKMTNEDDSLKQLSENILDEKGINGFSEMQMKKIENNLMNSAKCALATLNMEQILKFKVVLTAIKKAEKLIKKDDPEVFKMTQQVNELKQSLKEQKLEHERIQSELNRFMNDEDMSLTLKENSSIHRKNFISNVGSVQSSAAGVLDKSFKKINEDDMAFVESFLNDNIQKFKTRLSHNLRTMSHQKMDMKKTIQSACRTDGIPMILEHVRQKPQRAKLILILDVSGSCSAASKHMLIFMHKLKEMFPGGCEAYAFVNTLYDITDILSSKDTTSAIDSVFKAIPTRGAYSNYERPILELSSQYRSHFTRESMVLWIGDFRNNKNGDAFYEFKGLCRKVKRTFLLNTETATKWNKADSIVGKYSPLSDGLFQTTTIRELADFIQKIH